MIDMTEGKPLRLISRFALPLLAGNVLQQMYNLADSIIVGNFVGKEALAAVGNAFIINFLLVSLFMGLGMGATILISQFFGAKRHDKIKETIDTIYVGLIIVGVVVTVLGLIIAVPLLRLMNTPVGVTFDWSSEYLRILFIGTIFSFGYNINSGILQGIGDSTSPLIFLAIATVLNIALDLLFVVVFGWGVMGVALATIIAQAFSFFFGIWFINKRIKIIKISLRRLKYNQTIMNQCIRIGLPAGLQNMLFSLGAIVFQRLINGYGPAFMAGYSSVGKIDSFAFMPITSFALAVTTYVGQNIGAKKMDRVTSGVRAAMFLSGAVCIAISICVLIAGRYLMMAFSSDEEVIFTGMEFLRRLMPTYILLSMLFIINASLRGAGSSILPLITTIFAMLVVRVPSAYLLDHFFGKYEIFWCFGIGWAVGVCISGGYYLSGRWKKKAYQSIEEVEDGNTPMPSV
jgi:putative MATE family efflux protein